MQIPETLEQPLSPPDDNPVQDSSRVLLGIFLLLSVFTLDFAREFLLPVTMAFFIALTFRPVIRKASKKGIPAWFSATVFMVILTVAAALVIYALGGSVAAFIADAPEYTRTFNARLQALGQWWKPLTNLTDLIFGTAASIGTAGQTNAQSEGMLTSASPSMIGYVFQSAGYSIDLAATIALTAVTAAFIMASGDMFYEKLIRVLPTLSDKKRALRIVYDVEDEISAYIVTVTLINFGLSVCVGAAFWALEMPMPYLWAALVFAFNFVPYVGALFGMLLAAFIAVATFDTFGHAALVPAAYATLNALENQFVTPFFLGRRLQLNSVAILIFLTFWTWQWGIAGTMLAVPILMTAKVLCGHIENWAAFGEFLSGPTQEANQV